MKILFRLVPMALLFTAACGTFQVQVITHPTTATTPTSAPPVVTPAYASPQQCGDLPFEDTLPPNPDDPSSYIGHHYNEVNLPEGLEFKSASLLTEDVVWQWVSRPGFDMQFLTKIDCRSEDGTPYSTVVDAIWVPRPADRYDRTSVCAPLPDASPVMVFGKYNPNQPPILLNGISGWSMFDLDFGQRVNLSTMMFEPLPLTDLECIYIISGLGG